MGNQTNNVASALPGLRAFEMAEHLRWRVLFFA
jgi:hypothetical protein